MKPGFILLKFIQTQTLFRWGLDILFNVFPVPIYDLVVIEFSKAANLFVISIRFCSLTSGSFSFLKLNLYLSTLCAVSATFTPRKYSWYSFLLEAESTAEPWCDRKEFMSIKNLPAGIKRATFRFVAQHLSHCATEVPVYMYIYIYRHTHTHTHTHTHIYIYTCIQGVPGGKDLTSGECSLGQTITI